MNKLKLVLFASVCFSTIPQFALAQDACQSGQKCWADIEETEYGTPVHKTLAGGTNIHTTEAGEDWRAVRANGGGGKIGVASVKTLGDGVTVTTDGEEADGLQVIGGGEIEFNGGSVTTNGAGAFAVVSGTVGEGEADMGAVLSVDRSAIRSAYVGAAALSGGIATIQNTNITINQQAVADENANTRVGAGPYGLVASGTAVGANGAGAGKTGAFLGAAGVDVTVDGIATADSRSAAVAAFDKGVVSLVTPIAGQLNSIDVLRDKTAGLRADAGPVEKTAGAIYSSGSLLVQTSGNHSPGVVAANGGRVELVGDGKVAYVSTIGADAPALFAQGDGSLLTVERFNVETYGDNSPALRLEGKSQANILNSTLSSGASASVEVTGGAPQLTLVNSHLDKNNGTLFDVKGGSFASIYAESSSMAGRIVTASDSATDLTLGQGSVWNVSGSSNLGDLFSTNSSIQFARPVGNPAQAASYKTLTVSGDYFADNARLGMNVYLAGDNAPSDHLVVNGSTAGSTVITVNPTGGTGAQTRDGIEIVHVNGQSDGLFELSNPNHAVNAGLYSYTLHKGNVTKPGDGNWYLASQRLPDNGQVDPKHPTPVNPDAPVRYSAGVPVYEGYMQNMMALSKAPTLQQRTGNRYVDGTAKPATAGNMADPNSGVNGFGVWARVEGSHNRLDPKHSTTGMKQTINTYIMQAGVDGQFYEGEDGRLIAGITGQYGRALGKVKSVHGDGDITTNAWSLGATATWYGNSGFYVDTQGQLSWFDNDLDSRTANTGLANGRKARGYMASIEAGQRFGLDQNWSLTPQAQLSWSRIKADSFDDVFALHVAPGTDDSLTGRLGLAADYRNSWLGSNGQMVDTTVYGIANVYQEFKSGTHITLAGVDFKTDTDKTWGGLGAGGTYAWDNNTYAVYGEGSVNTGLNNFGKNYAVKGSLGFRVKW